MTHNDATRSMMATPETVQRVQRNLQKFGYTLSFEAARVAVEKAEKGERP